MLRAHSRVRARWHLSDFLTLSSLFRAEVRRKSLYCRPSSRRRNKILRLLPTPIVHGALLRFAFALSCSKPGLPGTRPCRYSAKSALRSSELTPPADCLRDDKSVSCFRRPHLRAADSGSRPGSPSPGGVAVGCAGTSLLGTAWFPTPARGQACTWVSIGGPPTA